MDRKSARGFQGLGGRLPFAGIWQRLSFRASVLLLVGTLVAFAVAASTWVFYAKSSQSVAGLQARGFDNLVLAAQGEVR